MIGGDIKAEIADRQRVVKLALEEEILEAEYHRKYNH